MTLIELEACPSLAGVKKLVSWRTPGPAGVSVAALFTGCVISRRPHHGLPASPAASHPSLRARPKVVGKMEEYSLVEEAYAHVQSGRLQPALEVRRHWVARRSAACA